MFIETLEIDRLSDAAQSALADVLDYLDTLDASVRDALFMLDYLACEDDSLDALDVAALDVAALNESRVVSLDALDALDVLDTVTLTRASSSTRSHDRITLDVYDCFNP